jgi:hypothetical protein
LTDGGSSIPEVQALLRVPAAGRHEILATPSSAAVVAVKR